MDLWGVLRSKERYKRLRSLIKCTDELSRVKVALPFFCLPSASSKEAGQEKGDSPTDRV